MLLETQKLVDLGLILDYIGFITFEKTKIYAYMIYIFIDIFWLLTK